MINVVWDMVPLALLAQVTLGKMVQNSASELETVEQPYLHAANVRDFGVLDTDHSHRTMWFSSAEVDYLDIKSGDVVVVEGGAVGKSAYVKVDLPGYGFQNSILRVRARKRTADGRFIQYSLQSAFDSGDIARQCSSVSLAHFPAEKVNRFRIPHPPLETQQRIADYLDRETTEIDAAVADLDSYVGLLEIRKKAKISHAVLGDAESGQRKLLNEVIGTIPSSWALSKFSIEFSESNELNGDDVAGSLLSISEFHGVIVNRRGDEGQQSSEDVSHYRVVHPGQLAANMMWLDHGGLGVSALHGHISPDYRAFDISERINPTYAHYLLRSKTYVDHFSTISVGVRPNAKRTTKVTLGMTPIPIPPLDAQARIIADLDREVTEINDLIVESKELRDLLLKRRSVLITDVVTGRKQV